MEPSPSLPQPHAQPTPQRKSNLLWWVIGVAAAAVVLITLLGALTVGYFLRGLRVRHTDSQVAITTPVGDLKVDASAATSAGLPIYPGAERIVSGKNLEVSLPGDARVGLATVHYRTADPLDKVDAWYRAKLGPGFEREDQGIKNEKLHRKGVDIEDAGIAYVSDQGDLVRVVALSRMPTGSKITLLRVGAQEAQ